MSTFRIGIETIDTVIHHPNADRLDIATLEGMSFQFVVGRDTYKTGDPVVYFPVDAICPVAVTDKLGLTGKLSGKSKDRVKTIKLRGEISQGVVGPVSMVDGLTPTIGTCADGVTVESIEPDYSTALGVTKYEPPVEYSGAPNNGSRRAPTLPEGVFHYDIEGCDRYKKAVEGFMQKPMFITEKVEGSHMALTRYPDGRTVLSSRNHALLRGDPTLTCFFHEGADNAGWFAAIEKLATLGIIEPDAQITIRGELIGPGVQGNIYKLEKRTALVFDIEVRSKPVGGALFLDVIGQIGLATAPRLCWGGTLAAWLDGKTVQAASNGKSMIKPDILREGIVIRPWLEEDAYEVIRGVGRPILKQRSPEYLAGSEL